MQGVDVPNPNGTKVTAVTIADTGDDVNVPNSAWQKMERVRRAPRALMGGTQALRDAGEEFLPKKEAESPIAYKARLKTSVLFNAFKQAVKQLSGKVFAKPISVEGADANIDEWQENIDLQGNAMDVFARAMFENAIAEGLGFILVDYPTQGDMRPVTLGEWKASGERPYWVHIKPQQVIGWRTEAAGGAVELTMVRILETVTEPRGMFGEKELQQVRVLERGEWTLWRKADDTSTWHVYDHGSTSLDYIPLVVLNLNPTSKMEAEPPLIDLADQNIKHWQSLSSQDHILDYSRFPLLFGKALGIQEGTQLVIGPNGMITSENEQADLKHVEHTGAAISAGRDSLQDIEARMAFLAMEPMLQQQSGSVTATKTAVDTSSASSALMAWAVSLKDALEAAMGMMSDYVGGAGDVEVKMNFDFVLSLASTDGPLLLQSYQAGAISRETFLKELMRRGTISDDLDIEADGVKVDEEKAASLESQAKTMKNMGMLPQSGPNGSVKKPQPSSGGQA